MGKGTIKVKRKCCRSTPACKSCPIVVLREVLRDAKAKDAKKAEKKAEKARENGTESDEPAPTKKTGPDSRKNPKKSSNKGKKAR